MDTGGNSFLLALDAANVPVTEYEPLAGRTTLGIGGRARYFSRPESIQELTALLEAARKTSLRTLALGRGSKLLINDSLLDALVIDLTSTSTIEFDGSTVCASAGVRLPTLLREASKKGLKGLEPLAGIPGTVGGALIKNAGGRYGSISDVVRNVSFLDEQGRPFVYDSEKLLFGYRESNLRGKFILEATLSLEPSSPFEVKEAIRQILAEKQRSQPLDARTAGCVFKNPPGKSAGALIDQAGLKGYRVGGAYVSTLHANFIINDGTATFSDVMRLIDIIRDRVLKEHGIELELEIEIWQ